MNKYTLACQVAKATGKPLKDVITILNSGFATMAATILDGEKISINELGSFDLKDRPQKSGYDIVRNIPIIIPKSKTLKFVVSPSLKKKIHAKYDNPVVSEHKILPELVEA